jgi:2-C-methyl-D-erythritol 4-phosphate cytidylyltransferase
VKASAVITAGGNGSRIKSDLPKQFISIAGLPMIAHTLRAFERAETIDRVVVVLPKDQLNRLKPNDLAHWGVRKVVNVVAGGPTRQASVGRGLESVTGSPLFVAIHDAARCLITPDLIDKTVLACARWDGAIAALPVRDTLKRVKKDQISKTEPREGLWAMQTPQVFRFLFIREAYRLAAKKNLVATDDAAVAEFAKGKVRVVEGSTRNLKVTLAEDLKIAELLLKADRK